MNREQAVTYLKFSGFSDEQIKAYSDGASAVLDKVRAEIDEEYDKVHPYDILIAEGLERALDIIDKYIEEGKS